tara:strand:- start:75 stop:1643 length:1569 start_codon:yes stop_codon:yes gene_type:complete
MSDSLDLNVNNYSQEELLQLLNLDEKEEVSFQDITNASNPKINKFTSEDKYDLANFYQQVQNKLLEDIDFESDEENLNTQYNSDSQIGSLWKNEYKSQEKTDPVQGNKTTNRKQQVSIFEQNEKFVMNRNQLGVNNDYQLPVAQGIINPTLKNTTNRIINIDSQFRDIVMPYNPDPNSPSSPTNFTVSLTDRLYNTLSIQLTSFSIPFTWYTIDGCYQANSWFYISDSSDFYTIDISSGNYSPDQLVIEIDNQLKIIDKNLDISYSTITGKTVFTNNSDKNFTFTFYDICNNYPNPKGPSCTTKCKFNNNLGYVLGFRGNVSIPVSDNLHGQLIYYLNSKQTLTSEAFLDIHTTKYFSLILDDFNQNHLNRGIVGINPTEKNAEIPSYFTSGLDKAENCTIPFGSSKKTPSYVQNAPRKLTQAQLYTINQTTLARNKSTNHFVSNPVNTNVLAVLPIRILQGLVPGQLIVDDFNLKEAKRVYFGPVDIERIRVRLINDKGYTVNLNFNNWSFTLNVVCLYQY